MPPPFRHLRVLAQFRDRPAGELAHALSSPRATASRERDERLGEIPHLDANRRAASAILESSRAGVVAPLALLRCKQEAKFLLPLDFAILSSMCFCVVFCWKHPGAWDSVSDYPKIQAYASSPNVVFSRLTSCLSIAQAVLICKHIMWRQKRPGLKPVGFLRLRCGIGGEVEPEQEMRIRGRGYLGHQSGACSLLSDFSFQVCLLGSLLSSLAQKSTLFLTERFAYRTLRG